MAWDAKQLLEMSQQQLDPLFSAHDAGPIPDGEAKGTAIVAPGTQMSEKIAELVNIFWPGRARCSMPRRGCCETTFWRWA